MTDHPNAETRRRYVRGLLDARQFLEADDHFAACAACREAMSPSLARAAGALRDALAGAHLDYEQMEAYVDGAMRGDADDHLRVCAMCAREVEDLRRASESARPRRWMMWVAAAAVLAAVFAGTMMFRPADPPLTPPRISKPVPVVSTRPLDPELARVLTQLASGVLPSARVVEEFHPQMERTRGGGEPAHGLAIVAPLGVIEDTTPLFRWTAARGATFVVEVFDGSYRRVARSESLRADAWRPAKPLARGATYSWQVTATRGGTQTSAPAPPAPPARFRILDDASIARIDLARAANDHLAMALVYAREGALDRAIEEMSAAREARPDSAEIRDALATLQRHQPAPTATNPPQ